MKRILKYFLQGLILFAPLAITGYIIYLTFDFIDGILREQIKEYMGHDVPGLGALIIFVFITLLGLIGSTMIARPFKRLLEKGLDRAPILKAIYTSLVDLFSAFVGKEKKFNIPVIVCINKENNLWKIGFITQKSLDELGVKGLVGVYFPHSYNFSGELYLVDSSSVKPLDMPPAEAMKFVVSGGITHVN